MYINDPKRCKSELKKQFVLSSSNWKRREPRTEGGDYCISKHFELSCPDHSWFRVVIDLHKYENRDDNGCLHTLNYVTNYISLYYDHPEYGTSEIASDFEYRTYDCRDDLHEDIMRALITAYGVILTYKPY